MRRLQTIEIARRGQHVESDGESYVGLCASHRHGGDVVGFRHINRSGDYHTTLVLAIPVDIGSSLFSSPAGTVIIEREIPGEEPGNGALESTQTIGSQGFGEQSINCPATQSASISSTPS